MIMQGSAEALKRRRADPERVNTLADAILSAADRAQGITRQLLAFARRSPYEPTTFDLQSRAAEIIGFLKRSTRGNIETTFSVEPDAWPIRADPHALEVALINLAANARDAMPEGGRLQVGARNVVLEPGNDQETGLRGEYVAIAIEDTGSGIPDEHLGRIFEPFYTTKGAGKGTGLGLSQVYGFAKQSGGDVKVTSHFGQGTTFTLYLPRSKEVPVGASAVIISKEEVGEGRVLLVEDNPEVAQVTESMLLAAGYTATCVNNANSALQLIQRDNSVDVVLSDIVMEGMSGLELADGIRQRRPELPIVLMTGYSEALARGSSQGLPVLSKPFRQAELISALRGAKARASQPSSGNVIRLSR
jgi:two-component system NtrC family sensor kinase